MQISESRRLAEDLELVLRLMRRVTTAGDVSMPAAAVIARLVTNGPHRLSDLASAEGVSQPNMTQLVGRLERDGLVERGSDPTDGRAVVVSATRAGLRVVELRRAERADAIARLVETLAPADQAALRAAMPALDHLAESAQNALAGIRATPAGAPA